MVTEIQEEGVAAPDRAARVAGAAAIGSARRLLAGERASWIALVSVLTGAVALRFYGIDHLPGINGDEPQYAVHARSLFAGEPIESLRTGSDLPMNPVFFAPVVLLQWLLPESLFTLRLAAVLQSLAAIALSYLLFRTRGKPVAALFALAVAVLPVHLGYARFAWDPTAIPTGSVLALAAAVNLRPLLTVLAFALSLWVHPTSFFLLPVLAAPFLIRPWPRDVHGNVRLWSFRSLGLAGLVVAGLAAWTTFPRYKYELPSAVQKALDGERVDQIVERAGDLQQLYGFFKAYLELLSGPTIYRYIVGSLRDDVATWHVILAAVVVLPVAILGVRAFHRQRRWVDLSIALGLLAALAIEYLVAGPLALAPKTERYAMCLTIPGCYVLAASIDAIAGSVPRANVSRWAAAAVGCALLVSFSLNYLVALRRPNPDREDTFRTGRIEPKRRALQIVRKLRDPSRTTLVYVEDWWIYWTVRYLAPPESGIRVTIRGQAHDYRFPRDFNLPDYDPSSMERFGIAWAGHRLDGEFEAGSVERRNVRGYEREAILRVHKLQ